jgi:hypothetical protein
VRRPALLAVVTAGVALAAAGCGGSAAGTASPATGGGSSASTTTSSAAPKFDLCAVLPADLLSSQGITATPKPDGNECQWQATGQDIVSTELNSYALGQRPDPGGVGWKPEPLAVGARKALLMRADSSAICGVDIALASDITFSVIITAQDSKTYVTACDRAKALATAAEPKLPVVS